MKSIVLLISIFAIIAPNFCNAKMDVADETVDQCRAEFHISDDESKRYEEELMTGEFSEEEQEKAGCYFACIMEKEGFLQEESVMLDQWHERIAMKAEDDEVETFYAELEGCIEAVKSVDGRCPKVFKFIQCIGPTMKRLEDMDEDDD